MKTFKFNRDKLEFKQEGLSVWKVLRNIVKYLFLSLFLAVLYYALLSCFVYFGKERVLKRQNETLQSEYTRLRNRLDVLDGTILSLQEKDREIYRTIFNSDPPVNLFESDGVYTNLTELDTVKSSGIVRYMSATIESVGRDVARVNYLLDTVSGTLNFLGASCRNIPSIPPIRDFTIDQVGASVGRKINPFYKSVTAHNGLDLFAATGTEIIAPADGVVESVGQSEDRSAGKVFVIDHLNGYKTRYANVGAIHVRKGQRVSSGDVIGSVGMSGMSMMPHLHYEVIYLGKYLHPEHYFFSLMDPYTYRDILNITQNTGQSAD